MQLMRKAVPYVFYVYEISALVLTYQTHAVCSADSCAKGFKRGVAPLQ